MKRILTFSFLISVCSGILFSQTTTYVTADSATLVDMRTARVWASVIGFPSDWSSARVGFVYDITPMPTRAQGGSWRAVGTAVAGRTSSTTLTALTPNTTYYVRAALCKTTTPRDTVYSANQITFTTLPAYPGELRLDTIADIGLSSATFRATLLNKGSFPYSRDSLGFIFGTDSVAEIRRPSATHPDSNFVSYADIITDVPHSFSKTLSEGKLRPSTEYYVRAFYITRFDTLFTSAKRFSTTSACDSPPRALTVGNIDITSVELQWTPAAGQTVFELEYGSAGIAPGAGQNIQNIATPYTLSNLTGGRQYTAYVRSVCPEKNSPWSNFVTFTTNPVPCAEPLGLHTEKVEATLSHIAWTPGNVSQSQWEIQLAKKSQSYSPQTTRIDRKAEAYFVGLNPSTTYKTRVRAVCDTLRSEWSEDLIFTTTEVGLEDVSLDFPVLISPNPTSGKIFLNTGDRVVSSIQVFNSSGMLVLERKQAVSELDMSDFPQGWYMIKVFSGTEKTMVKVLLQ